MHCSKKQLDAIKELINIGMGRAAGALNDLLDAHIKLQVPWVEVVSLRDAFSEKLTGADKLSETDRLSSVMLEFRGAFDGSASLLFPKESAIKLIMALTGEDENSVNLDALKVGTLTEVGNIVLNSVMGSVGNVLDAALQYKLPKYREQSIAQILERETGPDEKAVLLAKASFSSMDMSINGEVIVVFNLGSFETLLGCIDKAMK